MSTHAIIVRKHPTEDTTYEYVYVHYDGYPQKGGVGDILMNHVGNNQQQINEIFAKGDLRYIDIENGKLDCKPFEDSDPPTKVHFIIENKQEESRYIRKIMKKNGADYGYIFDDKTGEWRYYIA